MGKRKTEVEAYRTVASTSRDFMTTSDPKESRSATKKSRTNAAPNSVQSTPTSRLCVRFSLKCEEKARTRPPSFSLNQSLTTPNMAAVEGKIVTTGTHATSHMRLSRKKSVTTSNH